MNQLKVMNRPIVKFDAANRDHRRYYYDSLKRQGWGDCPVRFALDHEYSDMTTMVQRRLLQYYVEREFGKKTS